MEMMMMRPSHYTSLFLFLLISYTCCVSSQSDSCSSKLSVSNLIPFNTTGLSCFSAWTSEDFILRFAKTGTNEWSFVLSAPDTKSYVSIGFSPNGRMVGSSAMAGWISSSGPGIVKQYYLGGLSSKSCPPDQGSLSLVQGKSLIVSQSSRVFLAFQLTGQPLGNVIYAVGGLPSSGSYLPQHRSMATGTINISGNGGGGGGGNTNGGDGDDDDDGDNGEHESENTQGEEDDGTKKGEGSSTTAATTSNDALSGLSSERKHGLLALIGWGILMPIGMAMARFLKQFNSLWLYSHILVQGIGFILGVIGLIIGFGLDDEGSSVDAHKALGLAILVFGSLQVLALLARPSKDSKMRRYWNWYHHYVGRFVIVCAIGNIFYGLYIAREGKEWSYVYGIFIGCFAVIFLVLEEWRRKNA
ncbi:cytochrome b561 and DOMON domain-containing protein At3g07570-like [Typha angustifolia]|uniref:cytochrome b561 and DOMON domain-containing protein At3g07570-like n=1 Tax=Typha angustifolia TaxID=59011 RepID=UPI003C2BFC13